MRGLRGVLALLLALPAGAQLRPMGAPLRPAPSVPALALPAASAPLLPVGALAPRPLPLAGSRLPLAGFERLARREGRSSALKGTFDGQRLRPAAVPALNAEALPAPAGKAPRRGVRVGFKSAVAAGMTAALAAPVLHQAVPELMLVLAVPAAVGGALGLWAFSAAARRLRRALRGPRESAPPRRPLLRLLAGAALGAALGASPYLFSERIVETAAAVAVPEQGIRALDPAFSEEALAVVGENPVGRDVLNRLRDRSGRVRPPSFFVSRQEFSSAQHLSVVNGIFIDEDRILREGWTVEEFLADPGKQRRLARKLGPTLLHELFHASQARRSVLFPGQLVDTDNFEEEYEAHLTERLYVHEELRRDPSAPLSGADEGDQLAFYEDFDAYLRSIDEARAYRGYVHLDSEYYDAWLADTRARWEWLRYEGFLLLARRNADSDPAAAAEFMGRAAEAYRRLPVAGAAR